MTESAPPKVLISYSHDSAEHATRIFELSEILRNEHGIDCTIDQHEECPPQGWLKWMEQQVTDSKFVLMACTEKYLERFMGKGDTKAGAGVLWEAHAIYNTLNKMGVDNNTKFIPILYDAHDKEFIPLMLNDTSRYLITDAKDFDKLCNRLKGNKPPKAPLGGGKALPKKEIKTDIAGFLSLAEPIDSDLWSDAQLECVGFHYPPSEGSIPPLLSLAFKNHEKGKKIFSDLQQRYGQADKDEEVRIAIVRGPNMGKPGFAVHVGPHMGNIIKKHPAMAHHPILAIGAYQWILSDNGLDRFIKNYEIAKSYFLAPGALNYKTGKVEPFVEFAIEKKEITLRTSDEIIAKNDSSDDDYLTIKHLL